VNPSPQQLKDFLEQFDLNADGKIKLDEFSKIIKDYFLREVL
jgi:Ca2+-binding EF-hand superfamily protein